MPFFPLENTWTRAKEKGVQPEFVAKITPSCPTYPTSFFPEASARAPAHAHTHIHLCNPAPSVNSPSDVSRVLPMRGLCGWAPAAPCRKRAVSSCGWSHAGTNKPSTARRERERESCCHQRWIQRLNAGVQGDYDEEGACMHWSVRVDFLVWVFFFQSRELKVENCWWSCRRTEALPGLFLRLAPGIVARVSRDGIIPFFAFIQGIPASLPSPLSMVLEG